MLPSTEARQHAKGCMMHESQMTVVDPGVLQVDPHLDRFTAELQQRASASQTQVQAEQPNASLIAAARRAADELIVPGPLESEMPPPGSADKINAAVAAGNAAMAR